MRQTPTNGEGGTYDFSHPPLKIQKIHAELLRVMNTYPISFLQIPSYVSLLAAVGVMFCLVIDYLDGMHASRTGQASPAGEILDHSCDVLAQGRLMDGGLSFCDQLSQIPPPSPRFDYGKKNMVPLRT